jgi:hypothetical protein
MDNISRFMQGNPKYQKLTGPLRAAQICDAARVLANERFVVIKFVDGVLTLATTSSAASANLQMEVGKIKKEINEKLGFDWVKQIRFKLI